MCEGSWPCCDGCCRDIHQTEDHEPVNEPTGSQRDAASTIFNLPDYRVIEARDRPEGGRRVVVESTYPPGCPDCGVVAQRVHSRRLQRVRDIPVAGAVEVVWAKRRWFCDEELCARGTFAEATDQVPRFARSTGRLKDQLVAAVIDSGRAAAEVARAHGVSWWLVQSALTAAAAVLLPEVDQLLVRRLGIDEHRYRSVRWFRTEAGGWRRFEPWMTTLVDLTTGQVLGIVDGRDSAAVGQWLAARCQQWRDGADRKSTRLNSSHVASPPRRPSDLCWCAGWASMSTATARCAGSAPRPVAGGGSSRG